MNSEQPTNETNGHLPAAGIIVDDICFTLFRHKWLILVFVCLGLVVAAFVRITHPPKYASRAELKVKFVVDKQTGTAIDQFFSM